MSKIGKISISIPEKVKVALSGNLLNIEGPIGKKSLNIDIDMFELKIDDGKSVSIKPKNINQETKRLWGMNRSLVNNAIIGTIERVSKPGRRIFSRAESLPKINNGLGIAIISTPKGVMTDIDARKQKVGGEIICKVF